MNYFRKRVRYKAGIVACALSLTACQPTIHIKNKIAAISDLQPWAQLTSTDWKSLPYQSPAVHWDSEAFMERAESVLPRYRSVFEKACTIKNEISSNEITWQFLAAIAYQESHWIPDARSFTGVRGMMMLTRDTARAMGVSDRVNPTQSIRGGARYMQWILDSLPEQIHDRSRLPMALASYNMGPGYVLAARKITSRQGGDPNSWLDVKKRLRIFGQNRSAQAESFVRRTLRYYQLLNWMTSQEESLETS